MVYHKYLKQIWNSFSDRLYLDITTKRVMEVNSSNAQVHFSVNLIISGVVELYRNVGGGIFTLEDEEVCTLILTP